MRNSITPAAEAAGVGVVDRDPRAIGGQRHAGHDDLSLGVLLILKLFDVHWRHVPTECMAGCQQK